VLVAAGAVNGGGLAGARRAEVSASTPAPPATEGATAGTRARVPARVAPPGADERYVPTPAIAHYLRARVALGRGDEREAAQEIDLAIAFDPASAGLRAAAADLFLRVGNPGRAGGEARRAVDLGEKSDRDAVVRGHAVLGRIAASESRWNVAAAELGAAARIAEAPRADGADAPIALAAEDQFVLGIALESQRKWDEAAGAFARVTRGDDEALDALASLRRAHSLSRARRHGEALEVLAGARRAEDIRFATMHAYVLSRAGRSEEAAAGLRAEIAARAQDDHSGLATTELYEALGTVLVEAGRPADAIAELEGALSTRPAERRLVLNLAMALDRAGDVEGAASRALDLILEDGDDVEALNFVGYLLADHGIRLGEAEQLLVRAAQLAPAEGAVLDSLGWLWFRKGDTVRAIHTLERAEALAGPDATILDHLGDAYRAGGRSGEAARAWRRALEELDADPPAAAGEAERVRRHHAAIRAKLERLAGARAVR
jgi:tetratricopeptide (TPR) repeat protein